MFKHWHSNGGKQLAEEPSDTGFLSNPTVQKKDAEEKEQVQPKQMKQEGLTFNNLENAGPTVVTSALRQKIAQRKELEEDIRQNKPNDMNSNIMFFSFYGTRTDFTRQQ